MTLNPLNDNNNTFTSGTILVLRNGTEACLAEYSRQQCEGHTCNAHDFSEGYTLLSV